MVRTHGSASTYKAGCRCAECREAKRLQAERQRAALGAKVVPDEKHGTAAGYQRWGCRCARCREWQKSTR